MSKSKQIVVPQSSPLTLSIAPCPTRRWLSPLSSAPGILLVNGTRHSDSLANLESLRWIDEDDYSKLPSPRCSLEYLCEITHRSPAYIRAFPPPPNSDHTTLCITSFGLRSKRGTVAMLSGDTGKTKKIKSTFPWPNECLRLPSSPTIPTPGVLITDGFLLPTRSNGGIYIVLSPHLPTERTVRITPTEREDNGSRGWYYHRATVMDLTGDGRMSVLTARARAPSIGGGGEQGELVWLEMPLPPLHSPSGLPLESDGITPFDPYSPLHTPWKLRTLTTGPDVMFSVADLKGEEGTIEVIAAQFFTQKVSVHSVTLGTQSSPLPSVSFSRTIDDTCGYAYSSVLADLGTKARGKVIDTGSTATMGGEDKVTHVIVSTHEETYESSSSASESSSSSETHHTTSSSSSSSPSSSAHPSLQANPTQSDSNPDGGSVFAYEIPDNWKTEPWIRTTIASGFKCKSPLSIRPGAPGFVYLFRPHPSSTGRPFLALAGDGTESAYIYRPSGNKDTKGTEYELMFEIEAGGTVGSVAVGYGKFAGAEEGCAKIFVASYERDKVFAFAFQGIGDEAEEL